MDNVLWRPFERGTSLKGEKKEKRERVWGKSRETYITKEDQNQAQRTSRWDVYINDYEIHVINFIPTLGHTSFNRPYVASTYQIEYVIHKLEYWFFFSFIYRLWIESL